MGFTLDQLLETTGVGGLAGRDLKKVAAKQDGRELLKLAERCRRAADVVEDERPVIDKKDLVEKTAAVQIIRRTIEEIREIDGHPMAKTASAPAAEQAAFIKAALEAGHPPESIARFLEKTPGSAPARPPEKRKKTSGSIIG